MDLWLVSGTWASDEPEIVTRKKERRQIALWLAGQALLSVIVAAFMLSYILLAAMLLGAGI